MHNGSKGTVVLDMDSLCAVSNDDTYTELSSYQAQALELQECGKHDEAIRLYKKMEAIFTEISQKILIGIYMAHCLDQKAQLMKKAKQFDIALQKIEAVLKLIINSEQDKDFQNNKYNQKHKYDALMCKARILQKLQQHTAALKIYEELVNLDKGKINAYLSKVICMQELAKMQYEKKLRSEATLSVLSAIDYAVKAIEYFGGEKEEITHKLTQAKEYSERLLCGMCFKNYEHYVGNSLRKEQVFISASNFVKIGDASIPPITFAYDRKTQSVVIKEQSVVINSRHYSAADHSGGHGDIGEACDSVGHDDVEPETLLTKLSPGTLNSSPVTCQPPISVSGSRSVFRPPMHPSHPGFKTHIKL